MNTLQQEKVSASHFARNAYLYVRPWTLRQVLENTESTKGCVSALIPWAGRAIR